MGDKKFLHHIALQVFNTPLMIHSAKLEVIMRVLGNRIGLEVADVDESEKVMAARKPVTASSQMQIGVVPFIGTFCHREIDAGSGIHSYERFQNNFNSMDNDPNISAIILDIASSGGTVEGAFPAAESVHNARKPVYSYVNESAYSAGYLVGSGAKKIFLPPTGGVGSIGVRMVHVDQSEFDKKQGIKYTPLYVGERKVDFDPHSPLSEDAMKAAMEDLTEIYDLFANTVARYRGNLSAQDIKNTEASLFMGQHAVDIGLADQVMTFEEVVEYIVDDVSAAKTNNRLARGGAGTKKEVKSTMTTLAEFKAESPDLYESLMDQAKAEVEATLQAERTAQESGLQDQLSELKGEVKNLKDQNAQLEKDNFIRTENERKARNETTAETIWIKSFSSCDVPEIWNGMNVHEKIRNMVKTTDHEKDGVLDRVSFQAAVDAEIADWEGKGMSTTVLGSGYQTKTGDHTDPDAINAKKQEEADDAWVDEMLELSGDTAAMKKGGD